MLCTFNLKNTILVCTMPLEAELCCDRFSICTVVYLALSTYSSDFVALVVSTLNPIQRDFLLCEWLSLGLSALLFRLG